MHDNLTSFHIKESNKKSNQRSHNTYLPKQPQNQLNPLYMVDISIDHNMHVQKLTQIVLLILQFSFTSTPQTKNIHSVTENEEKMKIFNLYKLRKLTLQIETQRNH